MTVKVTIIGDDTWSFETDADVTEDSLRGLQDPDEFELVCENADVQHDAFRGKRPQDILGWEIVASDEQIVVSGTIVGCGVMGGVTFEVDATQ